MRTNRLEAFSDGGLVIIITMMVPAYYLLQQSIFSAEGEPSLLREALGADRKGKLSPVTVLVGIGLAFVTPLLALMPCILVALIWLMPGRRLERYLAANHLDDECEGGSGGPGDEVAHGGVVTR